MVHQVQIGLAFCTPIPYVPGPQGHRLALVTPEWHRARMGLSIPTNFNTINVTVDGMEVGDARNRAVSLVMESDPLPEYLFFLDYDVIPFYDGLTKLLMRARHFPDYDIISGVYCSKGSPAEPLIYKGNGRGPFWDWAIGDLITEGVTGVHMGLTLIRTSLFHRLPWNDPERPLFLTQNSVTMTDGKIDRLHGTEDLYFCQRAIEEADAKILVDTSVLAGHIEHRTGRIFGLPPDSRPVLGAKWMDKNSEEYLSQKKALDIGAGKDRRHWDGYVTYTTDIRADTEPDYVQDTRALNLPDAHFDLVASSHHLEHMPRWEQESVWSEMFRILKPGGTMEHVVPNIAWAAAKITDGQVDEHVMNVLYGAQEQHGYKREWNTHFFGYDPVVARALAENAGLVDVEILTYKDDPALLYNLVIRGTKPAPVSDAPEGEDECHSANEPDNTCVPDSDPPKSRMPSPTSSTTTAAPVRNMNGR